MTPVVIQDTVAIAANTTVENVINLNTAAQRYVRAPYNAIGKLFLAVSALSNPGLRLELVVDGKTIMDSSDSRVALAAAQLLNPDDMVVEQFFVREGAQLVLRGVNGSAGSLSAYYRIEMTEAEMQPAACRYTQRLTSIPASSTVQILSGLRFERPVMDSYLSVLASAAVTGLLMEIFVDGQSVAPAMPVSASNRMPLNPYDTLLSNIEVGKDSLIELRVQNTTVGAVSLFWRTHLQESVVG